MRWHAWDREPMSIAPMFIAPRITFLRAKWRGPANPTGIPEWVYMDQTAIKSNALSSAHRYRAHIAMQSPRSPLEPVAPIALARLALGAPRTRALSSCCSMLPL